MIQILWEIRTTRWTFIGENLFSIAYGADVISPVEGGLHSSLQLQLSDIANDELRKYEIDFLDEIRDKSQVKLATYKRKMTYYYNLRVKKSSFRVNDFVLQRVFMSSKEQGVGMLGANWERLYPIKEVLQPGTYWSENLDGKLQPHPWNVEHLRIYYQ